MTIGKTSSKAWFSGASAALALVASAMLARPAAAQSEADLRRQNQELTTRVKDLEAELDAARKQAEALQKRITALEAQLAVRPAGGGTGRAPIPPLEPENISIDESKADASPRALFFTAVESYKQAVGGLPMGKPNDRERTVYMRAVERWAPTAERELRMPVEWHVRLVEARRDRIVLLQAVDPVTDARLGGPFEVQLSRTVAARVESLVSQQPDPGVLVMKGTTMVEIGVNADRETPGSFDKPRFIGPFAEFEFTVEPSSITPYRPAPASQPAVPATQPAAPAPSK